MLFSGDSGIEYGYRDGWNPDGLYEYFGEGQVGDMSMDRGNAAVLNHSANGEDLHLFETLGEGRVRYLGQMVCTGMEPRRAPDRNGDDREAFVFFLAPVMPDMEIAEAPRAESVSLGSLRERALAAATTEPGRRGSTTSAFERARAIRSYVLKRSGGSCEGCAAEAPFLGTDGLPYLEAHHVRRLSDGGPDDPRFVIAICPNCHRRAHYSRDAQAYNEELATSLRLIEARIAD